MLLFLRRVCAGWIAGSCWAATAIAQTPYTWPQLRDRFLATNPTLAAGQINVSESRAQEITAYLRPNPDFTLTADGTQLTPDHGVWRPFAGTLFTPSLSYLHEREHKRELRLESAQRGTAIAQSQQEDLQRTSIFNLRTAFVQVLQQKAVLDLARESLAYYDRVLALSNERFKAGDIARVDLLRLQVGQAQYQADVETAQVNLRTAKIQLLQLLNERTPIEQFDVTGPFDFSEPVLTLDELHDTALAARPDLRAAMQGVDKADTDHRLAVANGSTDPTFSGWYSRNPSFNNPFDVNTIGASVSIPLRIFDRNQGEKARTQLDITHAQRLRDAAQAQVFGDVDSAFVTVNSNAALLKRYRSDYLEQASTVRDTISFSYQRGGASLLDFLSAESDYRTVRVGYLNLLGSFLTAAAQLNMAVGREVIQ
ncbi:MAG: TolC family protein [Acidobacteriia bacterium]|nr:TolC family protein [Terriglobia bacterium]